MNWKVLLAKLRRIPAPKPVNPDLTEAQHRLDRLELLASRYQKAHISIRKSR